MDKAFRVVLSARVGDFISKMAQAGAAVEAFDKRVQKTATTHKDAMNKLALGAGVMGAGILAGVGVAIKGYADFDQAMSEVKATGDDARQNIDLLRQAALKAGRDFGQFTAVDAADGITQLAKAGVSAADILGGGLTGALALAAAGQIQVGDAAEYTAKTMAQFGLRGDEASHVADLLAAGANKAVGEVKDFGDALAMGGTVAAQYGVSVDETVGTLAMFAQNALLGSDAGTSMKQMLLQLAQPTKKAQSALDEYNITAYDANGQFIGMAGLADQLSEHLGGLTQAQQNAALKTIFGSDAIRAATVLMKGGGDAVRQWTKDVNDQGYATEVAATKMDNLKGDLKALSGSFENLTIQAGSATNGGLRAITKDLTGLLDAANNHPEAAQNILLVAGAVGTLTIGAAGLAKTVVFVTETRTALRDLGITDAVLGKAKGIKAFFSDVKAGANGARYALLQFGLATAALTALALAVQSYREQVDKTFDASRTKVADYVSMISRGQTTFRDQFQFTEGVVDKSSTNMAESIKRALDPSGMEQFADFMNSKAFGTSQVDEITKSFGELDKALVQVDNTKAAQVFNGVRKEAESAGVSTDKLVQLFPAYQKQLAETANSLNVTNLSNADYVDWMGGKIPQAVKNAMVAQQLGTTATDSLGRAMDSTTASMNEMQKAADADAKAILADANAALQASGSHMGYEAAVDAATKSLKENGRTLDIHTEKGRANRQALDSIASSALAMVDADKKAGVGTDQLRKETQNAHDQFVKTARQMGMNAKDAENLANKYGLVPDLVATDFVTPGAAEAKRKADALFKSMQAIPGKRHVYIQSSFDNQGVKAYQQGMSLVKDKTVTINTIYHSTRTGGTGPGGPAGFQANGSVLDFYAGGGFHENHVAQIAPAGAWRVWAEEETGGEAYIPLGASKRRRSMAILDEVARRFGAMLVPGASRMPAGELTARLAGPISFHADGSLTGGGPRMAGPSLGPVTAMLHDGQIGTLAAAIIAASRNTARDATAPFHDLLAGLPAAAMQGARL